MKDYLYALAIGWAITTLVHIGRILGDRGRV